MTAPPSANGEPNEPKTIAADANRPSHVAMGLVFGWLRLRTASLLPGMAVHAAWNAFVIVTEIW